MLQNVVQKDMFQNVVENVDEIISLSFPVNWVFTRRLTNIEVGFILQPIF